VSRDPRAHAPATGAPEWLVSRRREPRVLTSRQEEQVCKAATTCAQMVTQGWAATVADRASTYVTARTWERLRRRGSRQCAGLAGLARAILDGKKQLHDLVGWSAGRLVGLLGLGRLEQRLAQELAAQLPLPIDAQAAAVARGLQVTGVYLCVLDGRDLERCECLKDLALAETQDRLKEVLLAAMNDWAGLADPEVTKLPPAGRP
jgi:hypothetical protein